jgi:hypothetical protein
MVGGLPLGAAVVLAALIWAGARVGAAVLDGRTFERRDQRIGELLGQVDAVRIGIADGLTVLENLAEDVATIRGAGGAS